MPNQNDGGPAFPFPELHGSSAPKGMSLRDYFAAQALQGICAHHDTWGRQINEMAVSAYELADAMLAARGAQ